MQEEALVELIFARPQPECFSNFGRRQQLVLVIEGHKRVIVDLHGTRPDQLVHFLANVPVDGPRGGFQAGKRCLARNVCARPMIVVNV